MTPGERLGHLMSNGRLVCDPADVAAVLEMTVWSVHDAVRKGKLPLEPIRVGRRVRFRVSDLAALVGAVPANALTANPPETANGTATTAAPSA